jgi:ribosomal protein S18 acetylase RimI-like enzyme
VDPLLVGYATLGLDKIRLTNKEMRQFGPDLEFSDFGAIRIQMLGTDHRLQRRGYGKALLRFVTERARRVSAAVPARFLLADANIREVEWYERRGFVPNRSEQARSPNPERTVSMRLDLEVAASATEDQLAA